MTTSSPVSAASAAPAPLSVNAAETVSTPQMTRPTATITSPSAGAAVLERSHHH